MDKKNTLIGILCILAGIGFLVRQTVDSRNQQLEQLEEERAAEAIEQAASQEKPAAS